MGTPLPTEIHVMAPDKASSIQLATFQEMVLKGGEVNAATLPDLIDRSLTLAFAMDDGQLIGVGAIKRPYDSHRKDVFNWAGTDRNPDDFEFELGWVYVSEPARGRGIAGRLVEALVPLLAGARVYATSRVNNERMHTLLVRFGFVPAGAPYPSRQNEPAIQLFLAG